MVTRHAAARRRTLCVLRAGHLALGPQALQLCLSPLRPLRQPLAEGLLRHALPAGGQARPHELDALLQGQVLLSHHLLDDLLLGRGLGILLLLLRGAEEQPHLVLLLLTLQLRALVLPLVVQPERLLQVRHLLLHLLALVLVLLPERAVLQHLLRPLLALLVAPGLLGWHCRGVPRGARMKAGTGRRKTAAAAPETRRERLRLTATVASGTIAAEVH